MLIAPENSFFMHMTEIIIFKQFEKLFSFECVTSRNFCNLNICIVLFLKKNKKMMKWKVKGEWAKYFSLANNVSQTCETVNMICYAR